MSRFLNYFLKGLAVVVPLAVTIYVCVAIFTTVDDWLGSTIDRWLGVRLPGAGFLVTIVLIALVGALASNLVARGVLGAVERVFNRLPFVRLLYSSTRDLLDAFVGEKKRFDKPVMVTLSADANVRTFGFLTQESLERLGFADHVVVYVPQSYGFAGNLIVVPAAQVSRIDADAAEVMAYIISGAVTALPSRATPPRGEPRL
jgi:uncharacterized membrane protein